VQKFKKLSSMTNLKYSQPLEDQLIKTEKKSSSFPAYDRKAYHGWRIRILYSVIIGYATFYFCRQNFNIAMPALMDDFGVSKTQLGWILTWASIVYGIGKSLNGFISDKSNARYFMPLGLAASAIVTLLSGFSTSLLAIGIFWILNNWFQSMGQSGL
jgi:MFS transporter, OPA family, glycerol-3-phosphate transporter